MNVNVEQMLRISVDVIQLQDIDPAFRLLREGIPLKMKNEMHYALISQAFSELQDLKISKMLVSRFNLSVQ